MMERTLMRSETPGTPGPQTAQSAHDEFRCSRPARTPIQRWNDGRLGERVELRQ